MLFNSYLFILIFFPIVFTIYWLLPEKSTQRRLWLLGANVVFYASAGSNYLLLLIALTGITYLASRFFISSQSARLRTVGLLLVFGNLGVLAIFKYLDFLAISANSLIQSSGLSVAIPILQLVLPLGISFYTFNLLSYGLDTYQGRIKPAHSLLGFSTYATFFPTISSGPLIRYQNFRNQQGAVDKLKATHLERGAFSFTIGLAKKLLVADTLAIIVNPLFTQYETIGFWGAWIAAVGFTFQLYFDFSGYTDMAVGIGHFLGYKLPQNFDAPFTSRNISEFWQRWHITLSHWFRDYFFLPLSRTLLRIGGSQHRDLARTVSLILTMVLVGLWHGAAWTFVLWGIYQGALLAAHAQSRSMRLREWPSWLARSFTFISVVIGMVLIRSSSLGMALGLYSSMLGLNGFEIWGAGSPQVFGVDRRVLVYLGALLLLTNLRRSETWRRAPRAGLAYAAGMAILFLISVLLIGSSSAFIYFQF